VLGVDPGDGLAGYAGVYEGEGSDGAEKGAWDFAEGVEEAIVESESDGKGELVMIVSEHLNARKQYR
jgi:hypothetical protein